MILITLDASAQKLPLVIVRVYTGNDCQILFSEEFGSIYDAKLAVKMLKSTLYYLGENYRVADLTIYCENMFWRKTHENSCC